MIRLKKLCSYFVGLSVKMISQFFAKTWVCWVFYIRRPFKGLVISLIYSLVLLLQSAEPTPGWSLCWWIAAFQSLGSSKEPSMRSSTGWKGQKGLQVRCICIWELEMEYHTSSWDL